MKITNKHKLVKKGDENEKKQAMKRIRRHDFDTPRSKYGHLRRVALEKPVDEDS